MKQKQKLELKQKVIEQYQQIMYEVRACIRNSGTSGTSAKNALNTINQKLDEGQKQVRALEEY